MTPAAWVEATRISAARHLLENGHDTPKRVAAKCGFANIDTLRRSFIRHVGITPAEYRKRQAVPWSVTRPCAEISHERYKQPHSNTSECDLTGLLSPLPIDGIAALMAPSAVLSSAGQPRNHQMKYPPPQIVYPVAIIIRWNAYFRPVTRSLRCNQPLNATSEARNQ